MFITNKLCATQQPDLSACTKYNIQAMKKRLLLKMDWYSPKHVERILKIKSNNKKVVHLVGYIHIARCCTVHTMSNNKFSYLSGLLLKWLKLWVLNHENGSFYEHPCNLIKFSIINIEITYFISFELVSQWGFTCVGTRAKIFWNVLL